ncbi:MAG: YetF domain-containing protein, partial [Bradymonadaceae bacterium]
MLTENLRRSDISMDDLRSKMREANAFGLDEVEVVVVE